MLGTWQEQQEGQLWLGQGKYTRERAKDEVTSKDTTEKVKKQTQSGRNIYDAHLTKDSYLGYFLKKFLPVNEKKPNNVISLKCARDLNR